MLYLNSILFLIAAALIPPLVLLGVVYRLDKIEREPPGLLIALFFRGVLAMFPILVLEVLADQFIDFFLLSLKQLRELLIFKLFNSQKLLSILICQNQMKELIKNQNSSICRFENILTQVTYCDARRIKLCRPEPGNHIGQKHSIC